MKNKAKLFFKCIASGRKISIEGKNRHPYKLFFKLFKFFNFFPDFITKILVLECIIKPTKEEIVKNCIKIAYLFEL